MLGTVGGKIPESYAETKQNVFKNKQKWWLGGTPRPINDAERASSCQPMESASQATRAGGKGLYVLCRHTLACIGCQVAPFPATKWHGRKTTLRILGTGTVGKSPVGLRHRLPPVHRAADHVLLVVGRLSGLLPVFRMISASASVVMIVPVSAYEVLPPAATDWPL